MSGKGKDEPRVGYADEEIALTQKLARPKVTKPASDLATTLLKPTQGGAVDASALRRVRKVSAPNHVAIRELPAEHEPMTIARPSGLVPGPSGRGPSAEATVARIAAIPVDAYRYERAPFSEGAPSTTREPEEPVPASTSDTLDGGQGESFDDITERGEIYIPESRDVESLRSMRGDAEPASLVTKQVPADVVKILRSRAALESEVVRELSGDPPSAARGPESLPMSSQAKSEALVLTKLASTLDFGADAAPSPRPSPLAEPQNKSPLASTQLSDSPFVEPTRRVASLPGVTPAGGTPAPKPGPQLHTLPLGMKPADFMAGLVAAGSVAQVQSASASAAAEPAPALAPALAPGVRTGENPSLASSGQLPTYASSNHLPAAQPSSGVFPQGGPQRFPSGSLPAQSVPQQAQAQQVQQAQQAQQASAPHAYPSGMMQAPVVPGGTYPPGMMQAPVVPGGTYPPGMMQAPVVPGGTYPPGMVQAQGMASSPMGPSMQGPQGQGTFPPGSMQGPGGAPMQGQLGPAMMPGHQGHQGQGTFPPGGMQVPMHPGQGTFPPGSMHAPQQGQGTFPPGSMQVPMHPGQGTFPPGSMQASQHGQGTFPPGSMQAPMQVPLQGQGQGPVSNASFSQVTVPPSSGSGPTSNGMPPQAQGPHGQVQAPAAAPGKSKSGIVLLVLFLLVVLACMGAWLKLKHKGVPWKHSAREVPMLVARV